MISFLDLENILTSEEISFYQYHDIQKYLEYYSDKVFEYIGEENYEKANVYMYLYRCIESIVKQNELYSKQSTIQNSLPNKF